MNTSTEDPPDEDFVGKDIHAGARAVFITIGVLMILFGVIGNSLFLIVIFKQFSRKKSVHILFVANLTLADLLTLGYWFTFFVLDLILKRHPVVNNNHCVVNGVLMATLYLVSVSFLVSISLNRYLHVCHSHLYSRVFTLPRTVAWCLLTWLASLLLALVPVLDGEEGTTYRYNTVSHFCSFSRKKFSYVTMFVIAGAILSMLCVAYCNFAIFRHWSRSGMSNTRRYPLLDKGRGKRLARWKVRVKKRRNKIDSTAAGLATRRHEDNVEAHMLASLKDTASVTERGAEDQTLSNGFSGSDDCSGNASTSVKHGPFDNSCDRMSATTKVHIADDGRTSRYQKRQTLPNAKPTLLCSSVGSQDEEEIDKFSEDDDNSDQTFHDTPVPSKQSIVVQGSQDTEEGPSESSDAEASMTTQSPITSHLPLEVTSALPTSLSLPSTVRTPTHPKTAMHQLQKLHKKRRAREMAFVRSLFVVFLLLVFSFVPYGAILMVNHMVPHAVTTEIFIVGGFFLFLNYSVNWIVYGVMNPAFKQGYAQLFKACGNNRKTDTETVSLSASRCSLALQPMSKSNPELHTDYSASPQSSSESPACVRHQAMGQPLRKTYTESHIDPSAASQDPSESHMTSPALLRSHTTTL